MAYIDQEYFQSYTTTEIDESEFAVLANRATEVIDILTIHKIVHTGFDTLPPFVQEQVKKATAAQLETLYEQGGIAALTGNAGDVTSATIGKFSFSTGGQGEGKTLETMNGIPISPLVSGYLSPTGLLYRGISR